MGDNFVITSTFPTHSAPSPVTIPGARRSSWPHLRAGVVGLGKQALEDHVPGLLACEGAQLVAVCDTDAAVVERTAQRLGVPGHVDHRQMFDEAALDIAIVCVPHHAGRAVVEDAAARKIHILKEKPFATTLNEARALVQACEDAGIHLMVTLQRRFNPIYTSFLQLADQIGTPFAIDARYTIHTPDPSEGWRGRADQAGGGCIIDMGYHVIDMIIWYFGLPNSVWADTSVGARPDREYDAEDTAMLHFRYDTGLYGSLLLSRFMGPRTEQIRLTGSRGIVDLERGRIRRLTNDGQVVESLAREQSWPSAASCQIDHFCRIVHGLRINTSGPRDHLDHMRFIEACYLSAHSHAPIAPKELS